MRGILLFGITTNAWEERDMLSYFMVFSAGALLGSLIMGLYVAFVAFRDTRGDW